MSDIPLQVDRRATGFDLMRSIVELTQAAESEGTTIGRGVLTHLASALGDLVQLMKAGGADAQHALLVAQIFANVAQPDGVPARKVSRALGL